MQTLESTTTGAESNIPFTFDLPAIVRVLKLERRVVLIVTLVCGVVFYGFSFLLHNTFKATAVVLPPDHSTSFPAMLGAMASASGMPSGGASSLASLSMKNPADLYVALMSGRGVEDAVIKRFGLQQLYRLDLLSQTRKQYENNCLILADEKTGLISIAFIDRDPNRAAQIANGIIEAFDQSSSHLAITDAQRRRAFFDQQLTETKANLTRAEEDLKKTTDMTGLIQPDADAKALIEFGAQLRAQIASKTVELESLQVYLSNENPQVQTARRELQGLQGQAAALAAKTGETGGDPAFQSKRGETNASLEYMRKLRELRFNESLFDLLGKNLEAAKLDEAREGSAVQVVDAAIAPDAKYGPHRSLFLVGGLLLGFLSSSLWVIRRWSQSHIPRTLRP